MLFLTFLWEKLFIYLFKNNHKSKTYSTFGLSSQKNHSYEAVYGKLNAKIGWKITQTNHYLY